MKITKKNRFYESRLSYKGGNDETLTRPENLNLNSRGGGGDINYTKSVNVCDNFLKAYQNLKHV